MFCPVKGSLSVCDYQFSDEGLSELTDRLKEMLEVDAAEEDLDATQEITAETMQGDATAGGKRLLLFTVYFFCIFTLKHSLSW